MAETRKSVFETLNPINVNDKVEVKNGFKYLSWAWAWGNVKKIYPDATFKIIKNEQGWIYHKDGRSAWVEVEVTIKNLTHSEILPVMDYRNNSIPLEKITSFDANKAVHRCLVKCLALHGLGLYIYAGEDLPEEIIEQAEEEPKQTKKQKKEVPEQKQNIQDFPENACTICRNTVSDYVYTDPKTGKAVKYTADAIIKKSTEKFGAPVCYECMMKQAMKDRKKVES